MTGRVLAGIALRVWGVVFVIDALVAIPQTVTFLATPFQADASSQPMVYAQQVTMVLAVAANLLVGLCLIALAPRIATAVIPDTEPLGLSVDASGLTGLAFAVTGLVILLWGLKDVAAVVYMGVTKPGWIGAATWSSYAWREQHDVIVRAIVELAAGVLLMVGREGIANAWRSMRRGREVVADDTGDAQ